MVDTSRKLIDYSTIPIEVSPTERNSRLFASIILTFVLIYLATALVMQFLGHWAMLLMLPAFLFYVWRFSFFWRIKCPVCASNWSLTDYKAPDGIVRLPTLGNKAICETCGYDEHAHYSASDRSAYSGIWYLLDPPTRGLEVLRAAVIGGFSIFAAFAYFDANQFVVAVSIAFSAGAIVLALKKKK